MIDENYYITEMNQRFVRYFGEMLIGAAFSKTITGCEHLLDAAEMLIQTINQCSKEQRLISLEDAVYHKD